jgi:choline-phosphate cytidylyltransferase
MKRVYIDGVFDLFHRGHLESLLSAKNSLDDPNNTFLIVGVIGDNACESYKRKPIISEDDRYAIVQNIKCVDLVIENAPLIMTEDFINEYKIDMVVHGFANDQDREKQKEFFKEIRKIGKFKEIGYYNKISTTDIINKLKN